MFGAIEQGREEHAVDADAVLEAGRARALHWNVAPCKRPLAVLVEVVVNYHGFFYVWFRRHHQVWAIVDD